VEGLKTAGSLAREMTPCCTGECCVIEEGELVYDRGEVIRQRSRTGYRTSDDIEEFLLDRAMGPIGLLLDPSVQTFRNMQCYRLSGHANLHLPDEPRPYALG